MPGGFFYGREGSFNDKVAGAGCYITVVITLVSVKLDAGRLI